MRAYPTPDARAIDRVEALAQRWRRGLGVGAWLTSMHRLPAQQASYGQWPEALDPRVLGALRAGGLARPYRHQAQAAQLALVGQDVVVACPTASGKSLCYHVPALHHALQNGAALYLYPTRALAQDQRLELGRLVQALEAPALPEPCVYDSDARPEQRQQARAAARLLITNPDMLHAAILPHHAAWARFLRALRVIIVDELHLYRGVFGAHVANVFRRLARLCAHYGARPTWIMTSATIANPLELAQALTDRQAALVHASGAPQPERLICMMSAPILDQASMRRMSAQQAAAQVAHETLSAGLGTIVFARSRQGVEQLTTRLKGSLQADAAHAALAERVASYRGGYLPEDRRALELKLRQGQLCGVVSTSALEVGVDIGGLDACIQAGYSGSVASTWQQLGRAGRRGQTALGVIIASDEPVGQFVLRHPEHFLARPAEHARLDADNLRVVLDHLRCACHELALPLDSCYGGYDAAQTAQLLGFMQRQGDPLSLGPRGWRLDASAYPAAQVSLRGQPGQRVPILDAGRSPAKLIGELDEQSAYGALYPGALYQLHGQLYRVQRLDEAGRALVLRSPPSSERVRPVLWRWCALEAPVYTSRVRAADLASGPVRVTQRLVGYTTQPHAQAPLQLIRSPKDPLSLSTWAYQLRLTRARHPTMSQQPTRWVEALLGLERAMRLVACLMLMCDWDDLGAALGAQGDALWLARGAQGLGLCGAQGQALALKDAPAALLDQVTLLIFDRQPGGAGLAQGLYERHHELMHRARALVQRCPCARGCPSCVGPPADPEGSLKGDALVLLTVLTPPGITPS